MNDPESPKVRRAGQKKQIILEQVTLYLRLLQLAENTVQELTAQTMAELEKHPQLHSTPAPSELARNILTRLLENNKIKPDEKYFPVFTEAFRPPLQRTPMGYQDFDYRQAFHKDPRRTMVLGLRRAIFFSLVLASNILGAWTIYTILSPQGWTPMERAIVVIFTFLFGWIAINFWTVIFGYFLSLRREDPFLNLPCTPRAIPADTKIALVMPVHNEEVPRIFAALRAMYDTIQDAGVLDHFDIYVISDSTSKAHHVAEELFWAKMCREVNGFGKVFYRRRKLRIHKKSGNVSDFCRRWGKKYKYMITLDADSIMGGELLIRMVNMMESRPDIGILQTAPMAANQTSLIARLQQFSSHAYGPLFFAGLRFWQLDESGFWGHNAIIRMEPFMKYCALPKLSGGPPFGGEILSHDFVEAALMRRAGWGVWLAYELEDSFEELPPNLLEELERDKRWCQGNIQHLRIMFMPGFTFGHRILFLQGNLFYFSSLMWFLLLVLMTANAVANFFHKTVYFVDGRSLFPCWTVEYRELSSWLLIATSIILFTPKLLSVLLIASSRKKSAGFGGIRAVILSVILETLFSTLLAPLRMIFHTWYVILNLIGRKLTWGSQARHHKRTSFKEAFLAHWPGTVCALIWALIAYAVNQTLFWWVSVIVAPLVLGIPISMFYSYSSLGLFFRKLGIFLTPPEIAPSKVLARYQALLPVKNP